jgi:hypothetical protein
MESVFNEAHAKIPKGNRRATGAGYLHRVISMIMV